MENINWEISFFYVMFVLMFLLELHFMFKNIKVNKWEKAKGMVLDSTTELGGAGEGMLKAKINYVYWVNGNEFNSTRVAYATLDTWFAVFKRIYVKIGEVEVYVNPDKTTESVLVPGIRLFHVLDMMIIIGLGLLFQNIIGTGL